MAYVELKDRDGLWVQGSAEAVRAVLQGEGIVSAGRVLLYSAEGEELWLDRSCVARVQEEVEA